MGQSTRDSCLTKTRNPQIHLLTRFNPVEQQLKQIFFFFCFMRQVLQSSCSTSFFLASHHPHAHCLSLCRMQSFPLTLHLAMVGSRLVCVCTHKVVHILWPSFTTPGNLCQRNNQRCRRIFIPNIDIIAEKWIQLKCPQIKKWLNIFDKSYVMKYIAIRILISKTIQ